MHRDNLDSLAAFVACRTQWRFLPPGEGRPKPWWLGLDYSGVRQVVWALKLKDARAVFNDIRAMEAAALEVLNAD